jgi:hypothetical protein
MNGHGELMERMCRFNDKYEFLICAVNQVPPSMRDAPRDRRRDGKLSQLDNRLFDLSDIPSGDIGAGRIYRRWVARGIQSSAGFATICNLQPPMPSSRQPVSDANGLKLPGVERVVTASGDACIKGSCGFTVKEYSPAEFAGFFKMISLLTLATSAPAVQSPGVPYHKLAKRCAVTTSEA